MNDLFDGFVLIYEYIDEFLILIKLYWKGHLNLLEFIINKLKGKGPKCNIERYLF